MKINKNKTYTVTQIANIAGVSKASVSRWLADRHVTPDHIKGKAKYFKSTYVEQYLEAHRAPHNKAFELPTTTELLQQQISQLREENKRLVARIEKQDKQIKEKDQQIANWTSQSAVISKLANDSHSVARKLLESSTTIAESDNKKPSSVEKTDNYRSNRNAEKSRPNWFQRYFRRK
ncbi:DNA-binding protein [Lactobacillus helveticus]|uniref:DNA-binding protein n=1 Tax=Lactobacillus helveticus TaxID=1587 RepID=UPI003865675B